MAALQTLGLAAFLVASGVVGARLLGLARRTRQLPETAIGLGFVLGGVVGNVLVFLWRVHGASLGPAIGAVGAAAMATLMCGALAIGLFTWRVFHARSAWAPPLFFGLAAVGILGWFGQAATRGFHEPGWEGTWFWMAFASRSLPYAWAALSAGGYALRMRRRQRLGLADAEVVKRFELWSLGAACAFAIFAQSAILATAGGDPNVGPPALVRSGLGLVCAGCFWLAFFPPAAWRARFASA